MAKLLSYYRLCPLIDIKSLLGISEASENGIIIVTLGRNIAIKYRLFDQKQLCSWRSKEKFSSAVYFDRKLQKYVAAFNQGFIRVWSEDEESLDKVKKYKFKQDILTVVGHCNETFVVFKCGSIYPLEEVLEDRKLFDPIVIVKSTVIKDICYRYLNEALYFGFMIEEEKIQTFYWTICEKENKNSFCKIKLPANNNHRLLGFNLIIFNRTVNLLTIWSDSKMYLKELVVEEKNQSDAGNLFSIIENISTNHNIKIEPLDENYISIYGSESNDEGSVLLIFNTQFKIVQSKQIHKLFNKESKIWKTFNYILIPIGQNLIVVPFCLESEKLAALIGSHKPISSRIEPDIKFVTECEEATWTMNSKKKVKNFPRNMKLQEMLNDGYSECIILEHIVVDILEDKDLDLLEDCLTTFTDIPEVFLANFLNLILTCSGNEFKSCGSKKCSKKLSPSLLPRGRLVLLDKILKKSFTDSLIIPHLRSIFSIDDALLLLDYLVYLLSEDDLAINSEFENCIIHWISLMIDSNYQKFILSKDAKIENILKKCKGLIDEHVEAIETLKSVLPVCEKLKAELNGKNYVSDQWAKNVYNIEILDY